MNYKNNDDDHIKNFFCIMLKQKVLWSLKNKAIKRFKSLDRYDLIATFFQRNCIEFALNAKPVRRYIPKNPLQYRLWSFATSPFCEYTVFIAILLNTTSLAMKFYHQPTAYTDFLDVLNQIFTYFFLVECILKLGAFRFKVNENI